MRRIAWLFLVVLGSVNLMQAQDSTTSGTACQSTCVTKVDTVSTCDVSCTDKSGEAVLVDDQGKVMTIANHKDSDAADDGDADAAGDGDAAEE